MMKWIIRFTFLAFLAGSFSAAFAQEKEKKGKLGEFVDDFKKTKKESSNDDENDNDDSDGDSWLGFLFHIFLSSEEDERSGSKPQKKPTPYPYGVRNGFPVKSNEFRNLGFAFEAGYFNHNAGGSTIHGLMFVGDFRAHRFNANLNAHSLYENLSDEQASVKFFGLNAGYEVLSTSHFIVRPYLGARNLEGLGIDIWGLEGGVRALMLPRKPLSVELDLAYSRLNGKPLTIVNSSIGVMIQRVELRLGAQLLRSDWTAIDGIRLGIRGWL